MVSPISPASPLAIAPIGPSTTPATSAGGSGNGGGSFMDVLGQAVSKLNSDLGSADNAMASFAAGGSADLSTVVLQMQEASLELKLGAQVRDRLLEAYQEVMRLQA
jgi:flagellar hook-basal body complex protein FliE